MMHDKKRKQKELSIFSLFMRHLVGFLLAILLLMIVVFISSFIFMDKGILIKANEAEKTLSKVEERLKIEFDSSLLPAYSSYIRVDNKGNMLEGNMTKKEIEKTRRYMSEGKKPYFQFYKVIVQQSGDIIIVKYEVLAHFSNPLLAKIIPYPEFEGMILILILIVVFAVITAMKFSRKLKRNLIPIVTATDKIKAQDLDFEIEPTQIIEFNASLKAIDQLKTALTHSLEKQWKAQQQKKSQLSALAHDIKTPLTVIKGDTELLLEDETEQHKMGFLGDIRASTTTIEKYLEVLMTVVNRESLSVNMIDIKIEAFVEDMMNDVLPLCKMKKISFNIKNKVTCDFIHADPDLLKRALINIADNALRYSGVNSTIELMIRENETHVFFEIKDEGKGFSLESLKRATEEFYTEDISRGNDHYGLGLNFAEHISRLHGGELILANRQDANGANVSFSIKK